MPARARVSGPLEERRQSVRLTPPGPVERSVHRAARSSTEPQAMATREPCPGCGGLFPVLTGPVHRYLESSPGCAAASGRLFARPYAQINVYRDVYRLAVDAYGVQHPGRPAPRTIQSAAIHLIRLCPTIEHHGPANRANEAVRAAGRRKHTSVWLEPPDFKGAITVADFREDLSVDAHKALLRRWAAEAWAAWSAHHATIRAWLPAGWPPARSPTHSRPS